MLAVPLAALCLLFGGLPDPPTPTPRVREARKTWMDTERSAYVLARLYWRENAQAMPVILLSPDIGTNRDGYAPIARSWAEEGFLVVVVTHQSGNCGAVREKLRGRDPRADPPTSEAIAIARRMIATDPLTPAQRDRDIAVALERIAALVETDRALKGRVNVDAVGIAGHGYAAATALHLAGYGGSNADPRLKAVLLLSSDPAVEWAALDAPSFDSRASLLFLSEGSQVVSPPFDRFLSPSKFSIERPGGRSFRFTGKGDCDEPVDFFLPNWAAHEATAFWKAMLRGDAAALRWLVEKKAADECGADCVIRAGQRGAVE